MILTSYKLFEKKLKKCLLSLDKYRYNTYYIDNMRNNKNINKNLNENKSVFGLKHYPKMNLAKRNTIG